MLIHLEVRVKHYVFILFSQAVVEPCLFFTSGFLTLPVVRAEEKPFVFAENLITYIQFRNIQRFLLTNASILPILLPAPTPGHRFGWFTLFSLMEKRKN